MSKKGNRRTAATTALVAMSMLVSTPWFVATAQSPPRSINSTSQGRSTTPSTLVAEQPPPPSQAQQRLINFQVLGANDLGMHCGDFDHRNVSILPPFNTLHAQVIKKGALPQLLDPTQAQVVYSAASNPADPAVNNPIPSSVYKTDFWDRNPRTGNPLAFDAYNAHYPPGVLSLFPLSADLGLPVPDLQRLYLGDHQLTADQQAMPSLTAPPAFTQPFAANTPQAFKLFYASFPFFLNFPFGYTQPGVNWFSAEGIPVAPFDDQGRSNPFPLMRVQALASPGNAQGLTAGTVMSTLDTPTPVSGELNCKACHTSAQDGGNGLATDNLGIQVATQSEDPLHGQVPADVSIEYAFDLNILRLHDKRHGTAYGCDKDSSNCLEKQTPVSCQRCHYSPALDLAHVGPKGPGSPDANGRQQTLHQSMSRVIHNFHATLTNPDGTPLFPTMPSPVGRTTATRNTFLARTCYQCHPGQVTKCFRGVMFGAGAACQDCHGNLAQVGNDFSKNVSPTSPGTFVLAADYYTNPATPRVPWANEPACQSCHTGDVNSNLANSAGVLKSSDGIRLLQAYRTTDPDAKPIIATNRRFAENVINGRQVLYRLSKGHGGVFCEACHGSTHAEWPNPVPAANDNVTPTQLQGFAGKLIDCTVCHGTSRFSVTTFRTLDANGLMPGPHGMHPLDVNWNRNHKEVFERVPRGTCRACHGANLQGSVLARLPVTRTLICDEARNCRNGRITLAAGTPISCTLCHERPD
ncbi:MAG TPA: cytochrome C [Candidatus Methylomirabilis sp.]|nr:cytochrome C [Candidatus Methylomirabilis sp.]